MRARASVLLAIAIATSPACARGAGRAEWPVRPVRVIVPFGPGSGTDTVARLIAPRLSERWGQPVVVDNRPAADGVVGVQAFVAATDRHTLLFTPAGPVTLSPLTHERLPFDPQRDLVPIAAVVNPSIGIAVGNDLRVTTLAELAALARAQPNRYLWAATGGLPDVIFKAFVAIERLQLTYVPYRDPAGATEDLRAGRLHVLVQSVPSLSRVLESGKAHLIAVATSKRIAAAPDVPTITEAGYPALTSDGKWGFFGWRDMPVSLRDRISEDVRLALDDPDLAAKLSNMGLTLSPAGADEFARALEQQRRQIHEIASIIGLKAPSSTGGR